MSTDQGHGEAGASVAPALQGVGADVEWLGEEVAALDLDAVMAAAPDTALLHVVRQVRRASRNWRP